MAPNLEKLQFAYVNANSFQILVTKCGTYASPLWKHDTGPPQSMWHSRNMYLYNTFRYYRFIFSIFNVVALQEVTPPNSCAYFMVFLFSLHSATVTANTEMSSDISSK
jgi:hypothetical protein